MNQGIFVVFEGSDGSGKATQFKLTAERLKAAGYEVDIYDFPRYDQASSYFVTRYLNGEYGPASEVSPYTASLFYALDRYEAAPQIRQSLADGKIVLANRYVGSNMAHQGAKFANTAEQRGFFVWADSLEFQLLGIPRPTVNFFLRVPAQVAYELVKKKQPRSYTRRTQDEHEGDIEHLSKAVTTYDTLCELFAKDFKAIECSDEGKIFPVTEINNRIWSILKPLLPNPTRSGKGTVINLNESRDTSPATSQKTDKSQTKLQPIDQLEVKDLSLLSIANLLSIPSITVDKTIDWPGSNEIRLNYYIPPMLPPKLTETYNSTIRQLIILHNNMSKQLEAKRPTSKDGRNLINRTKKKLVAVYPLAALANIKITGDGDILTNINNHLKYTSLPELRQFLQQIDSKNTKKQVNRTRAKVVDQILDQLPISSDYQLSLDENRVHLLETWPRNEFNLLTDYLFSHSNSELQKLASEIDQWPYNKKSQALKDIYNLEPINILEKTNYQFDIVDDFITLESLITQLKPRNITLQQPSPRWGYDVPTEIEDSGLADQFIECFDLSLQLYSALQEAGQYSIAAYAVLAGHRMRFKVSIDGAAFYKANVTESPHLNAIISQMRSQISEVHPIIFAA
ncbi:MAG TPA: hypothetical protein VFB03_02980, partial [Candidatus Saccharimonadales bacterium]|nr:hypothetical protein [Candidatus Saccharimonadales bacterium]